MPKKYTAGSFFAGVGGFDKPLEDCGCELKWAVEWKEDCQAVLRRHFPNTKIHGDITKLTASDLEPVDIITWGFPCFVAGTTVLTKRGLTPIESVVIGDMVWTHRNRWRPVTAIMNKQNAPIIEVQGFGCDWMTTTPEHPFYASTRTRSSKNKKMDAVYSDPEWVDAEDLKNKYWASPIITGDKTPPLIDVFESQEGDIPFSSEISESLMWLVGYWLCDGRLLEKNESVSAVIIGVRKQEWGRLRDKIIETGLEHAISERGTACELILTGATLAIWLKSNFGDGPSGKKIPSWLYECSSGHKRAFMNGYFCAYGSECRDGDCSADSVSKNVALGLKLIMTSLGYTVDISSGKNRRPRSMKGRSVGERPAYHMTFRKLCERNSSFVKDGHLFGKVDEIENKENGEVFNISVEEDESYVADGIVVHNCQDVSFSGKRKGLIDVNGNITRSGLFFTALDLIIALDPRVHIFENVNGLLTNGRPGKKGEDFNLCLETLGACGFDCTWLTVDSRCFGLAQRRKRIFGICTRKGEGHIAERFVWRILSFAESGSGGPPQDAGEGQEALAGPGGGPGGDCRDTGEFDFGPAGRSGGGRRGSRHRG